MAKAEVRCPNCGTSFLIGKEGSPVAELTGGIHYLVPETIRNENSKPNQRLKALREAGIDVTKLQTLMQSNAELKDIFNSDDPVIEELSKDGFIKNPELFRRWITAQTFRLISNPNGWTDAVRKRYNTQYVFNQTKRELELQIKLLRKGIRNDRRYTFFTFDDMKRIFLELNEHNRYISECDYIEAAINNSHDLEELHAAIRRWHWVLYSKKNFIPSRWLNCFKGAGAYYTLQNVIRTHGLVLPKCKDMTESLELVEKVYNQIISYATLDRRWDILMSLLVGAVKATNFELKY